MSEDRNEVELARAAGAVNVLAVESSRDIFVWFTDPETHQVLGMFAREINSVEDVKAHMDESRKKIAAIERGK